MTTHGGARSGSGAPTQLVRVEQQNRALARRIRDFLGNLTEEYPKLLERAKKIAYGEDDAEAARMLRFLLELPLKQFDSTEDPATPMRELREKWSAERITRAPIERPKEAESQGNTLNAEYKVIP